MVNAGIYVVSPSALDFIPEDDYYDMPDLIQSLIDQRKKVETYQIDGEWQDNLYQHPMITYARTHDNLIITPHIGGVTYESQEMAFSAAAQKLVDYFMKK